ncbi:MAG: MFS transporter [Theionarchaea archaeon]|nr:MFS transporter [Theionarchaea archaeon]
MHQSSYRDILKIRGFLLLWTGQAVSFIGDQFHFIAIMGLLLYEYNVSSVEVGTLMVALSAPSLIIGPLAGVYVDRWSRKWVMIVSDIIRGILVILIPLTTSLWQIYLIMFLVSSVSRFFFPAFNSALPNIVPREHLLKANSLSQTTFNASLVVGPALGALMVGWTGYTMVFIIDGLSFFFSALMIFRIHLLEETKTGRGGAKEVFAQMKEGFTLIRRERPILFVVSIFSGIMFLIGGINVLLLIFVRDILGMGIVHIGVLSGFQGAGMALGALAVGFIGGKVAKRSLMLLGTFLVGSFLALFGVNLHLIVSYGLMFLIGVSVSTLNIPATTLLQEVVPDDIRGRVFGVQGTLVQTFSIISIGWESAVASIVGAQTTIMFVGLLCALLGVLGKFFPEFTS